MTSAFKALSTTVGKLVPVSLQPFWNHAAGPQTVFFWAPTFKWGLVVAGMADMTRPAEKLSLYQSSALAATGTIWARYSLVIVPVNYNLFFVNFFLAITGISQLYRIAKHQHPDSPQLLFKDMGDSIKFWFLLKYYKTKNVVAPPAKDD